jgi:pyruvate/2-oxoglutarate dehydrogenase complex dihydrolipoamide acyltransferase (E2) component
MFGNGALWFIPLGGATVVVTVGAIVKRTTESDRLPREHLCLTVTFNHDIIDGAPAARLMKRFSELLMSADLLRDTANA